MSDKKEDIAKVAISLFAKNGFDGTSVRQISNKANVNIAMISYYFKSKEGLLIYICDQIYQRQKLKYELLESEHLLNIERLDKIIWLNIDEIIENYLAIKVLMAELNFQKRDQVIKKMTNLLEYVNEHLKQLVYDCNPGLKVEIINILPNMLNTTILNLIESDLRINKISEEEFFRDEYIRSKEFFKKKQYDIFKELIHKIIE